MHDPASELRRIPLPRTSVNKGRKKGRRGYPRRSLDRLANNRENVHYHFPAEPHRRSIGVAPQPYPLLP
jgi:hypothetical protein